MQNEYFRSRKDKLITQQTKADLLIYDLKINKFLCLNNTSALVWDLCNGANSVAQISTIISKRLKSTVTEEFVLLAIDQLKENDLLDISKNLKVEFGGLNRREVIRKVGLATVAALPLVTSVTAPKSVSASSRTCDLPIGTCIPPNTFWCQQCSGCFVTEYHRDNCDGEIIFTLNTGCPNQSVTSSYIKIIGYC